MVSRLMVLLSMALLVLAAVLVTGCGDGSERIVAPGTPDANQYRLLDGIDSTNWDFGDVAFDTTAISDDEPDVDNDDVDIATGDEDQPGDDWSWKEKTDRNDGR